MVGRFGGLPTLASALSPGTLGVCLLALTLLATDHLWTPIAVPWGHCFWHVTAALAADAVYGDLAAASSLVLPPVAPRLWSAATWPFRVPLTGGAPPPFVGDELAGQIELLGSILKGVVTIGVVAFVCLGLLILLCSTYRFWRYAIRAGDLHISVTWALPIALLVLRLLAPPPVFAAALAITALGAFGIPFARDSLSAWGNWHRYPPANSE